MNRFTPSRYGRTAQALHWVTAILVLLAFAYGLGGSEQRVYASVRDFERQLHETLGISVFALTLVRMLWLAIDARPSSAPLPPLMRFAARAVQAALYFLLIAVPLSAIAGAWLEGHALGFLGGLQIPPPVAVAHDLGSTLSTLHTWLGDAILWLAGFHALAAIYHHVYLKDQVLVSMLPRWLSSRIRR